VNKAINVDKVREHIFDVCIVGGGAVGLYLSSIIQAKTISVAIIEAGDIKSSKDLNNNFEPVFKSETYNGAINGRNFGLGGSTNSWGGVLVPYSKYDKLYTDNVDKWNFIVNTVEKNSKYVLSNLGVDDEIDFFDTKINKFHTDYAKIYNSKLDIIYSKILPPTKRNLSTIINLKKLNIFNNLVTTKWEVDESNFIQKVHAIDLVDKKNHTFKAKKFIICAGAIESTRILLEINEEAKARIFHKQCEIGQNLGDHISCSIAKLKSDKKITNFYKPFFYKNEIRAIRYTNNKKNEDLKRFFVHIIFERNDKGFEILRNILKNIQNKQYFKAIDLSLLLHLPSFIKFLYARYIKNELYVPSNSDISIQVDFEQAKSKNNRIYLSKNKDFIGRKQAIIDWKINNEDKKNLANIIKYLENILNRDEYLLNKKNKINFNSDFDQINFYDAYHPTGTCTFGDEKSDTLNYNLKVKNTKNLYSLSSAILPTAGIANPTFSLLCFAHELSNEIHKAMNY